MTIGIAASGPWAGAGILAGLRAVEAIGRGAIGGFVSLAVITEDQQLLRAETQDGGTSGLFPKSPPEAILRAPLAALISSGPNRPPPLSQFVAAAPDIGLVTGHRFPNLKTKGGDALNSLVLAAMQHGASAQDAIDHVIAAQQGFDAGFISLSRDGTLGMGNTTTALRLVHKGAARQTCTETGAEVATIHNAIQPSKAITTLSNEIVLDEMRQRVTRIKKITLEVGLKVHQGDETSIHIDDTFTATQVMHPDAKHLGQETFFGLGDRVQILHQGTVIGWLGSEPFMVIKEGAIASLDGHEQVHLPVHLLDPQEKPIS